MQGWRKEQNGAGRKVNYSNLKLRSGAFYPERSPEVHSVLREPPQSHMSVSAKLKKIVDVQVYLQSLGLKHVSMISLTTFKYLKNPDNFFW